MKCFLISFNSKRCDYEPLSFRKLRSVLLVSIPKGAIMSFALKFWFNAELSFNSKRCDYEVPAFLPHLIIFPCFNSKRCDYEFFRFRVVRLLTNVSIPKGAIMSGKVGWKSYHKHVSIPKGAIMRKKRGSHLTPSFKFQFQKVRLWEINKHRWVLKQQHPIRSP